MGDLAPDWDIGEARKFASMIVLDHDPANQAMSNGTGNPYDRCSLCGFTAHPCDQFDLARLLLAALDRIEAA